MRNSNIGDQYQTEWLLGGAEEISGVFFALFVHVCILFLKPIDYTSEDMSRHLYFRYMPKISYTNM